MQNQDTSSNGNNDHDDGEHNHNASLLNNTFVEEEHLENISASGSSTTGLVAGFATSSVNEGLTRRKSERQAAKLARLEAGKLPSVSEESVPRRPDTLPRALSPMSDCGSSLETSTDLTKPPTPPIFIPRRKPHAMGKGQSAAGNCRSPLNVNVGQHLSSDGNFMDIYIPSDLVRQFEILSTENTDRGLETGGIIAGVHTNQHFQVTHLLIPEQTAAADRWEVQDERQATIFLVYRPKLIMLGLGQC